MGCGQSASVDPQDRAVGSELAKDKKAAKKELKLLLLGAGGSGKSTFFKQLKTIHGKGFTQLELRGYQQQIYRQVVENMQFLIQQCQALQENNNTEDALVSVSDPSVYIIPPEFDGSVKELMALTLEPPPMNNDIASHIEALWGCSGIKKMYTDYRNKLGIAESTQVFFDCIKSIGDPEKYTPSEEHALLVRYRTTGMTEKTFEINGTSMRIVDVGGQRNERKKWIHFFDGVAAVLFVISLSCYDEVPFEDVVDLDVDVGQQNNMRESLSVFDKTANCLTFKNTTFILFLNKSDIMRAKVATSPITIAFPDYSGDTSSYEECVTYIRDSFLELNANKDRDVFSHITCATDKNNVKKLFNDVQVSLVNENLGQADLV